MQWLFSWEVTSVVVVLAITVALGTLPLKDFGLAKFFFVIAAADAIGGTIMGISRSGLSIKWQGVLVFAAGGCICLLLFLSLRYVDSKKEKATVNSSLQEKPVHKDAAVPDAKKSFPQPVPPASSKPQHHSSSNEDVLDSGHNNVQNAQSGTGNQQTITGHGANVQTMVDSPGGIQAGGDVNITGKIVPPPRFIPQSKFATAVSILKTAPAGSKVSFIIVGGGNEITSITNQVKGLFDAAKDKWEILSNSFVGSLGSVEITDAGIQTFHGEGINCTFGSSETLAYRIGVRAMEAAGLPCGSQHFTADNPKADISIMIGTRIIPEE
jgi:hypothetical protein